MPKLVAISDLHGHWGNLKDKMPPGDILVVAGDIFANYSHYHQKDIEMQMMELRGFDSWLGTLPYKEKLVIGGNHDFITEIPEKDLDIKNFILLNNKSIVIDGLKYYGYPYTPEFGSGWAWMKERNSHALRSVTNRIDDDTNILLSHGPPYGFLDISVYTHQHVGCELLKKKILQMPKLQHVFCGHIHASFGNIKWGKTNIWNVSYVNEKYQPVNHPVVVEF